MKQKIEETVQDYISQRKVANTAEGRQQIIDEIHRRIDFKYPEPVIDVSLDNNTGVFTINVEAGGINEAED
tara:strand:+ start:217 stop:429 length:213 start_codon:yes stop_codon:yes gene_type:complete